MGRFRGNLKKTVVNYECCFFSSSIRLPQDHCTITCLAISIVYSLWQPGKLFIWSSRLMGKLICDEMIQRNVVQQWLPCLEPYQTKTPCWSSAVLFLLILFTCQSLKYSQYHSKVMSGTNSGKPLCSKLDGFSEYVQTTFDPPPPPVQKFFNKSSILEKRGFLDQILV